MWTCPKCRSEVDDTFVVCWSCGTTRDGVEDPNFETADEAGPIDDPATDPDAQPDDSLDDFAGVPLPDLVECYTASTVTEAKFIADQLMEQKIPAVADSHDVNRGVGMQVWAYGPKVRVLPKDLTRARDWVRDYEERRKNRGNGPD